MTLTNLSAMKTKSIKTRPKMTKAKFRKATARITAELAELSAWLDAYEKKRQPRITNLVKSETITYVE